MDKRQKNILVWVLTWAGLLLAVLYSPFGSPELYGPKKFSIANQGVAFNGLTIATYSGKIDNTNKINVKNNSKKFSSGGYSGTSENSILDNNINLGSKRVILNNSLSFSSPVSNNFASPITNFAQKESNNSNAGGGIGGDLYSYSGKNSKSKGNNNQSPELISLTSDLSLLSNNNTTKLTATSALDGTTDPGGDPTGDPIPVGDGWILLLCLAASYGIWKFKISRSIG